MIYIHFIVVTLLLRFSIEIFKRIDLWSFLYLRGVFCYNFEVFDGRFL